MIIEIDTSILEKIPNISINQLLLLNLLLNNINTDNQDIQRLLSLVNEEDIKDLELQGYIKVHDNQFIESTNKLKDLSKEDKSMFDYFYELFPVYVIRPDGTKGFLRANINKCRKEYNRIVGRSKAMHEHICNCLKYEINTKTMIGKLGYMKTMWKWLTQREWETIEEQMKYDKPEEQYGTTIL